MTETRDGGTTAGVLPRVHLLLSAIAGAGSGGMRLKDLADATGVARPTVHRMLQDLVAVDYVRQNDDRRYSLGAELFWLGISAPSALPSMSIVAAMAATLAKQVGDTVYVAMRVSDGVRYVSRSEGDYPVQSRVVEVGHVKPFTTSYAGIALLASQPQNVQDAAMTHIVLDEGGHYIEHPELERRIRDAMDRVRRRGWFADANLVVPGLTGLTAPVPNPNGPPFVALSISAAEARIPEERAEELAPTLLAAARRIGGAIHSA